MDTRTTSFAGILSLIPRRSFPYRKNRLAHACIVSILQHMRPSLNAAESFARDDMPHTTSEHDQTVAIATTACWRGGHFSVASTSTPAHTVVVVVVVVATVARASEWHRVTRALPLALACPLQTIH